MPKPEGLDPPLEEDPVPGVAADVGALLVEVAVAGCIVGGSVG